MARLLAACVIAVLLCGYGSDAADDVPEGISVEDLTIDSRALDARWTSRS